MKLLIKGRITAIDVCTALALELAVTPIGSNVDVGLVTGTNGAWLEVPEGGAVIEAPLAVEEGSPVVVEAGEAELEIAEDPAEVIELEPKAVEEPPTGRTAEEDSGQ